MQPQMLPKNMWPWFCGTCGTGYMEYINGCPHCWDSGILSKVIRDSEIPGPGRWD